MNPRWADWPVPLLVMILGTAACSQGSSSSVAAVAERVVVSPAGNWYEPHVSIGPRADGTLLLAAMDEPRPHGNIRGWTSTDGGLRWKATATPFDSVAGRTVALSGDPVTAVAPDGTLIVAGLLVGGEPPVSIVAVARSVDSGASFETVVIDETLPAASRDQPGPEPDTLDKPWLAVDATGVVYASWSRRNAGSWDLYVARSEDVGKSFTPGQIFDRGSEHPHFIQLSGSGPLDMVWVHNDELRFARTDGADAPTTIARASAGHRWRMPSTASNEAGLDVCWSDTAPGTEARVLCSNSSDRETWSAATEVSTGAEALPALAARMGTTWMASVKVSGDSAVVLRTPDDRWSRSQPLSTWSGVTVCVADCDGPSSAGDSKARRIGDYQAMVPTSQGLLVATVDPSGGTSQVVALLVTLRGAE